jgi:hypothetical protein
MRPFAKTIGELKEMMVATPQTAGLNVLEHGFRVREAYRKLSATTCPLFDVLQKDIGIGDEIIEAYQIYHDCGKPLCADSSGRFPNHSQLSSQQWLALYPEDRIVAELMSLDMEFHTRRGEDIRELWGNPLAPILYLTAWAEIYANAEMFGGVESESFKIKRKRLIQAGKKYPGIEK